MAHAVYHFLVDLKPPDESEIPLTPAQVNRDFVDQALERFYCYRANYMDENNSSTPLLLVHRVGRGFCPIAHPEENIHQGDEIKEIEGQAFPTDMFDVLRRKALYAVLIDSFAYDELPYFNGVEPQLKHEDLTLTRLDAMSFDDVARELTDRLCTRLASSFRKKVIHNAPLERDARLAGYKRIRMNATVEGLEASSFLPFTYEHRCPEEYRAFDLREEALDPAIGINVGILAVDIHT
jgi:hypothetical protein